MKIPTVSLGAKSSDGEECIGPACTTVLIGGVPAACLGDVLVTSKEGRNSQSE